MSGRREAVATCMGERTDRGPSPWKQQTESVRQKRAPPSISRSSGAPVCSLDLGWDWELRERPRGGWGLEGHLQGGAGGLADGTRETTDLERELQEHARRAAGGPPAPGRGRTVDPLSGNGRLSP